MARKRQHDPEDDLTEIDYLNVQTRISAYGGNPGGGCIDVADIMLENGYVICHGPTLQQILENYVALQKEVISMRQARVKELQRG
jgi:hypothetical protein